MVDKMKRKGLTEREQFARSGGIARAQALDEAKRKEIAAAAGKASGIARKARADELKNCQHRLVDEYGDCLKCKKTKKEIAPSNHPKFPAKINLDF